MLKFSPKDGRSKEAAVVSLPKSVVGEHVCLFSVDAPDGTIRAHVRYHLDELAKLGIAVILILNVERFPNRSWKNAREGVAGLLVRRSTGTHFSAWTDAMLRLPPLWAARAVTATNDALLGPVTNLSSVIARALASPADIVGLTRALGTVPHLQPYFFTMKARMLALRDVQAFLKNYRDEPGEHWNNPRGLYQFTKASINLTSDVLFPHPGGPSDFSDPLISHWRELLEGGYPYLRVRLLRDQAASILGRPELQSNDALRVAAEAFLGSKPPARHQMPPLTTAKIVPTEGNAGTGRSAAQAIYAEYRERALQKDADAVHYAPLSNRPVCTDQCDVKLIAYYLPQFHPIPENDINWGRGFTEWRNVTKAAPLFVGHKQPNLPGELGFYDLRVTDTMVRQVELAKQYGIHALCFHFYWFAGRTLLERPVEQFRAASEIDMPFCLCWANENWSRRWDGGEGEVIVRQQHSPDDDVAFIRYAGKYLCDRRYLKIEGKPVLTVYRPELLPEPTATLKRWREEVQKMGLPDLYVVATNSFGFSDFRRHGFDALSEFPPHDAKARPIHDRLDFVADDFFGHVFEYSDLVRAETSESKAGTIWPGVIPSWDNTPRQPTKGAIYHGSTPRLFRDWLGSAIVRARANPEEQRFVMINAWNEWAEGAYLEPDRRFGYAYLSACRSAIADSSKTEARVGALFAESRARFSASSARAIVVHLAGNGGDAELAEQIAGLGPTDVYVTVARHISLGRAAQIVAAFPSAYIQEVDDRGRDMLALCSIYPRIMQGRHDFACKVVLDDMADSRALCAKLLSQRTVSDLDRSSADPRTGLLVLENSLADIHPGQLARRELDHMQTIAERLAARIESVKQVFSGAALFWFRTAALDRLIAAVSATDFEPELDQRNGTFASAVRNMIPFAAQAASFKIRRV